MRNYLKPAITKEINISKVIKVIIHCQTIQMFESDITISWSSYLFTKHWIL